MADTHGDFADPVGAAEYWPEKPSLVVLQISAQCVGAEIRDLNHAGQLAVNEHWCLDDAVDACPECPGGMERAHHAGVLPGHGLVVVVDEQPVVALGRGRALEVPLEPSEVNVGVCIAVELAGAVSAAVVG